MAQDATAGSRIVQGLDDLQTFTSQLEHVRGLMRNLQRRQSLRLNTPQLASAAERGRAGFLRRVLGSVLKR
jgi:hypothetical protein